MKIFTGKVISKKMDKTATVEVESIIVHPIYGKRLKRAKKYHVHDELDTKVGQIVRFVASKPFSRTKRWKITEIVAEDTRRLNQKAKRKKRNKS